ncbi:hypothetical protein KJ836_00080 [Patescibacteria group bacterium]|nr:hypothetical protein [Patescibacteria group bacterium]
MNRLIKINKKKFFFYSDWRGIIFIILTSILTMVVLMRPPWDPDMGWHIRNGQDILRWGVPRGDLFSYTMPGYPWVSHEWLTDVGFYLIYSHWGPLVLSIIFAGIAFGAYWWAARVGQQRIESTVLTVLIAAMVAMPVVGIRAQMITLLGLAGTLWLLFAWRDRPEYRLRIWWLVPIMLVWVNLHGGFAIGLVLIAVFWFIELLKYRLVKWRLLHFQPTLSKAQFWQLIGVGVSSFVVTFINPYTWRVYEELFRTVLDPVVRVNISEWTPVTWGNPQSNNLLILMGLIFLLWLLNHRKADFTKLMLAIVFLGLSLTSWRNLPLFSLVALPLLVDLINRLSAPKGLTGIAKSMWVLLGVAILAGYLGYNRYKEISPFVGNPSMFSSMGKYPYGAVAYIHEHQPKGNLFNEYNWGGYLTWQLPEKPVFIDGRMAIWKTPQQNIFQEYSSILNGGEDAEIWLKKYDVGLVLVYQNRSSKNYFVQQQNNWEIIYQDDIAILFQRHDLAPPI